MTLYHRGPTKKLVIVPLERIVSGVLEATGVVWINQSVDIVDVPQGRTGSEAPDVIGESCAEIDMLSVFGRSAYA